MHGNLSNSITPFWSWKGGIGPTAVRGNRKLGDSVVKTPGSPKGWKDDLWREFQCHFDLKDCMALHGEAPQGSLVVSWYPKSGWEDSRHHKVEMGYCISAFHKIILWTGWTVEPISAGNPEGTPVNPCLLSTKPVHSHLQLSWSPARAPCVCQGH